MLRINSGRTRRPPDPRHNKRTDLLVIIGPGLPGLGREILQTVNQFGRHLRLTMVGDGHGDVSEDMLPASIDDCAFIHIAAHGFKTHGSNAQSKLERHKIALAQTRNTDTVKYLTKLRDRYKNWKGQVHISSCFVGHVRKQLSQRQSRDLGPGYLHASAKHSLVTRSGAFEQTVRYADQCKVLGADPKPMPMLARILNNHDDCVTAFGECFGPAGQLIVHPATKPSETSLKGIRNSISGNDRSRGKPMIVGDRDALKDLTFELDALEHELPSDWQPTMRAAGGLCRLVQAGKARSISKWIKKDPLCEVLRNENLLHFAAEVSARPAVIKQLIQAGLDVNDRRTGGRTALHDLKFYNGIKRALRTAQALIDNGADVNARATDSRTPLHFAVRRKSAEVIALLVQNGAVLDAPGGDGRTALQMAAQKGEDEIVDLLLRLGAQVQATPLHEICNSGATIDKKLFAARAMIAYGADVNARTRLGMTALHFAAESESDDLVKLLVGSGADIDTQSEQGLTPLHMAAISGNFPAIEYLLTIGAKAEIRDKSGCTALHFASTLQTPDCRNIVSTLIKFGCNPDARGIEDRTPLHEASYFDNFGFVDALLSGGASVDAKDQFGRTALHTIVSNGSASRRIMKLLLSNGADINAQTKNGDTPLHLAIASKRTKLAAFLLKKGARMDLTNNRGVSPRQLTRDAGKFDAIYASAGAAQNG